MEFSQLPRRERLLSLWAQDRLGSQETVEWAASSDLFGGVESSEPAALYHRDHELARISFSPPDYYIRCLLHPRQADIDQRPLDVSFGPKWK
jgi:hypothetical protein